VAGFGEFAGLDAGKRAVGGGGGESGEAKGVAEFAEAAAGHRGSVLEPDGCNMAVDELRVGAVLVVDAAEASGGWELGWSVFGWIHGRDLIYDLRLRIGLRDQSAGRRVLAHGHQRPGRPRSPTPTLEREDATVNGADGLGPCGGGAARSTRGRARSPIAMVVRKTVAGFGGFIGGRSEGL